VGNVYDHNTGTALNHAQVTDNIFKTFTQPSPADPAINDGYYSIFAPAGQQIITATMSGGYGLDVQTPTVLMGDAIRQDFDLPAGYLSTDQTSLEITLEMGITGTLPFTLTNAGTWQRCMK